MKEVSIIGVDLAKNVFQLHGAAVNGSVVFRKKLTRLQFERFMAAQPACTVAMEACAGANHWARTLAGMGHAPLLIAPRYVKPFVKRHKNDSADAEAIVEAALRPTMRFVEPKTVDQQARAVLFRTRRQFVESRTVAVNALRAHLYEFGHTAPIRVHQIRRLAEVMEASDSSLSEAVRLCCREILAQIAQIGERPRVLDREIARLSGEGGTSRRLRTMPGVGPITALAVKTFAPAMDSFRSGRDFAAWLGLVPRQSSSGGKARLGKVSKAGQHDIRRLLVVGAMAAIVGACRRGIPEDTWLGKLMLRKPRILVAIALANKMARRIWAMLTKGESYRDPALAAA